MVTNKTLHTETDTKYLITATRLSSLVSKQSVFESRQWHIEYEKSSDVLQELLIPLVIVAPEEKARGIMSADKAFIENEPANGIHGANYSSCHDCLLIPGGQNNDRSRQKGRTIGRGCLIKGGNKGIQPLRTHYGYVCVCGRTILKGHGQRNYILCCAQTLRQLTTTPIISASACGTLVSAWNSSFKFLVFTLDCCVCMRGYLRAKYDSNPKLLFFWLIDLHNNGRTVFHLIIISATFFVIRL